MAGFRGAVSLAAALAVPRLLASGEPIPGRDMIVFVTTGVIAVTLAQGLLLPTVVRWAELPPDTALDQERQLAKTLAAEEALAALPQVAAEPGTDQDVVDRVRHEYQEHLRILRATSANDEPALRHDQHYTALRLALLARKRATIVRLRDQRDIDDSVLRRLQTRLDIEEVRLQARGRRLTAQAPGRHGKGRSSVVSGAISSRSPRKPASACRPTKRRANSVLDGYTCGRHRTTRLCR